MTSLQQRWPRAGQAITARREHLGFSQAELARRSGVSDLTIRRLESGEDANYRPKGIRALEDALSWAPGSIRELVAGGNATELPEPTEALAHESGRAIGQGRGTAGSV